MRPKYPSRQVLSGELMVALFAIAYAFTAGTPGPLNRFLLEHEGQFGLYVWMTLMGAPSAWLIWADMREWFKPTNNCSSVLRSRLIAWLGCSWLYAAHLMLVTTRPVTLLSFHAVIGCFACAWFYIENRRVRREVRNDSAPAIASR